MIFAKKNILSISSISMSQGQSHIQPALNVCLNTEVPQISTCIFLSSSPPLQHLPVFIPSVGVPTRQHPLPPITVFSMGDVLGSQFSELSRFREEYLIAGFHVFKENV